MKDVGAELRVNNLARAPRQNHQQNDGHNSDEDVGNDQAIAQTPEEFGAPTAPEPVRNIKQCQQRKKAQETHRRVALQRVAGPASPNPQHNDTASHPIELREALPEGGPLISFSAHEQRASNPTLPDSVRADESALINLLDDLGER